MKNNSRYYKIAGITIKVDADLPITSNTFDPKFKLFEVDGPGRDNISLMHHFSLPDLDNKDLGKEVYRKVPWAVYKNKDSWTHLGILKAGENKNLHRVAIFNKDYTRASIYNHRKDMFLKGNQRSLTLFPTDQILLARLLADRQGFYLHACGVKFQGEGLLFAGYSGAGKSTMATMLGNKAKILCDDRIIVRRYKDNFKIYGTWSHGDVKDVSQDSAMLKAVFFLQKAKENRIVPIAGKRDKIKHILNNLIKPFADADWWGKTLPLIEEIIDKIPFYKLRFDKSGDVVDVLKRL